MHFAMVRGLPKPALFFLCFVAAPALLSVGARRDPEKDATEAVGETVRHMEFRELTQDATGEKTEDAMEETELMETERRTLWSSRRTRWSSRRTLPNRKRTLQETELMETERTLPKRKRTLPELTEDACEYPEHMEFQVGEQVRLLKPTRKITSVVTEVVCPDERFVDRVCVSWGGCWPTGKIRKMSPLALALNDLQHRAADFGRSVGDVLPQKFAAFASVTGVKITELSGQALAAVNVCDPDVRAQVQLAFVKLRTRVNAVAYAAAEQKPAAKKMLGKIAIDTKRQILALGAVAGNAASSVAERAEVVALVRKVEKGFDKLKQISVRNPTSFLVGDNSTIALFFDDIGELSYRAGALAKDAYQAEVTQQALASIQSGAGELLTAAAEKWTTVRAAIQEYASASGAKVAELGVKAFDAVNLCKPEVRQQLQAGLATVQSRVERLATAVAQGAHVVQESLREFASSMIAKIKVLSEGVRQNPEVRSAIAAIMEQGARLQEMVADKSHDMEGKARQLAEGIQKKVSELTLKMTQGEASTFDDSEDVAE